MAEEPGNRWTYNSGAAHLLSAIIQETTGMTALAFAEEHVFAPLGISEAAWRPDPQGRSPRITSCIASSRRSVAAHAPRQSRAPPSRRGRSAAAEPCTLAGAEPIEGVGAR